MPAELAAAFVHVPRPPTMVRNPEHGYQRRFVGGGPTWYVDRDFTDYSHQGALVYRDASTNEAELVVRMKSAIGDLELTQLLSPIALREVARRLLDAAHDIEAHPAPEKQED
jgi:hypothetical protein